MKTERLRVLLLIDVATFHAERFSQQLKKQGCRVLTASLENGQMRRVRLRRYAPVMSMNYLLAIPQVRNIIKRFRPDVINAHYASGYGFVTGRAVGEGGPPIVLNIWGSDILVAPKASPLHLRKTKEALERADCVLGDSRYLIDAASKIGKLKDSGVIPWGIERAYLSLHKSSYTMSRPLKVITPRLHEEVYNNDFLLESLSPLARDNKIQLTFPDFGSLAARFKTKAAKLAGDSVQFYSRLPRKEFLAFAAQHDIYLSASRSDSSPASLIEAMALGLIPVAADIEGVREWLGADTGFVFTQDDAESVRAVFTRLTAGDDPFAEMRRRNLERVELEAIFEDNMARQIQIMKDVAGKG